MSGEFKVVAAETAAKGIDLIKNEPPDLGTREIRTGGYESGWCAARSIKLVSGRRTRRPRAC
jgi:hypothetical protein